MKFGANIKDDICNFLIKFFTKGKMKKENSKNAPDPSLNSSNNSIETSGCELNVHYILSLLI